MRYIFELNTGSAKPRLRTVDDYFFHVRKNAETFAFELAKQFDMSVNAYDADTKDWLFSVGVMKLPKLKEK